MLEQPRDPRGYLMFSDPLAVDSVGFWRTSLCAEEPGLTTRLAKLWRDIPQNRNQPSATTYTWTQRAGAGCPSPPKVSSVSMSQKFFRSGFDCSEGAEDQPHDAENVGRAMEEACLARALAIPLGLCDVCV